MRDLNEKISEWRSRMAAGGIKSPAVLDELESHLREDVEREARAGWDEAAAFENAVNRIGRSDLLKAEFAKIKESKEKLMSRIIGIACCVFTSLYSLMLAPHLFLIHELSPMERILGMTAVIITLVSLVGLKFSYKILPVIRNKRVRIWIVAMCGLVAVAWLGIFSSLLPNVIVPYVFRNINVNAPTESLQALFAAGLSLLWAMTLAAVLGGAAYGLEEAARRGAKMEAYV
jgi:cation transport ATPase